MTSAASLTACASSITWTDRPHRGGPDRPRALKPGPAPADPILMSMSSPEFVLGLDLDGVVMDYYPAIRVLAAEWLGVPESSLTPEVTFGLSEWGIGQEEYHRLHRFAVDRGLFLNGPVLPGAPQSLRRLSQEGVRIRIVTHRLCVHDCHRLAAQQTVEWLDFHAIPYWDLCFMREKGEVSADVYLDDAPQNIEDLQRRGRPVIAFTNSTNRRCAARLRVDCWADAEKVVRGLYHAWRTKPR